ncbi:MAG: exonuclease SbcCD subunit D [Lachnospiraceae bacterium]|nr:exonuclease SbcCD subunit D [Lachnospiraceae bacterium]
MRFLHTADLHIGKSVNEFSMLEDQQYVLEQMAEAAREYQADAFVIAGDVYDRSVPAAEAVELLDQFITKLARENIPVLMIAGNHDSGTRLSFAQELLAQNQVYIAGEAKEDASFVTVKDTQFVLLPFFRPARMGAADSDSAMKKCMESLRKKMAEQEPCAHSVLVTHCFVTNAGSEPELSESESTVHVGGIDNVDASVFDGFSYVALGHIHKPQQIGSRPVWYAGTPLAYSFSENSADKGMNLVELLENGETKVSRVALKPLHAMRTMRASMQELLFMGEQMRKEHDPAREDYLRMILTDEEELLNPIQTLRSVYPNVMQIVFARHEKRESLDAKTAFTVHRQPQIDELFASFYELVTGERMDDKRRRYVEQIVKEL